MNNRRDLANDLQHSLNYTNNLTNNCNRSLKPGHRSSNYRNNSLNKRPHSSSYRNHSSNDRKHSSNDWQKQVEKRNFITGEEACMYACFIMKAASMLCFIEWNGLT